MYVLLTILIVLICILLGFVVLVQNPKGGGLSATFGGVGNQILGAKKSTDFIEKLTWGLAISLLVLSLLSAAVVPIDVVQEELPTTDSEIQMQDYVPTNDEIPTPQ